MYDRETMMMMMLLLFLVVVAIVWWDTRTRRIPNALVLPLLGVGFFYALHTTSSLGPWLLRLGFTFVLLTGYLLKGVGAGDVKLWTALLLWTPENLFPQAGLVMGLCLLIGSMLSWLLFPRSTPFQPAAWKTLPYTFWLVRWTIGGVSTPL